MTQLLWYTPRGRELFEELAGPVLAEVASRGSLISVGRQTATVSIGRAGAPLLVKWRVTRPGMRLRTCFRASNEKREAHVLLSGHERGLGCPEPLLVVELRRHTILKAALSVRPYLEAHRDGDAVLAQEGPGPAEAMVRSLRRWHDAGFRHGDCWPRNILVPHDGSACIPIGCPKGTFVAPGERVDRRRVRDVARLLHGISRAREEADREALFLVYAEGSGKLRTLRPGITARIEHLRSRETRRRHRAALPARTPPFPDLPLWRGEWHPLRL